MTAALLKITGYSPFKTLLIREYWENRRSMFYWPLLGAGLTLGLALASLLFGNIHIQTDHITLSNEGRSAISMILEELSRLDAARRGEVMTVVLLSSGALIALGAWLTMIFNSLGSLYDERKDNSILFWKSMPVSDRLTVLSKVASNVFVTPLMALAFVFLTQIASLVILSVLTLGTPHSALDLLWGPANLPTLFLNELVIVIMYGLWALPVFAYLLLASVHAKRTPFLTAALPVAVITIAEALLYDHSYLMDWIDATLGGDMLFRYSTLGDTEHFSLLSSLEVLRTATLPSFWIGLGVAAGLLALVIRLRKRSNQ